MKLNIKKLVKEAVMPSYATPDSNGLDFVCTAVVMTRDFIECRTGIAMEIPTGYVGLLFPRSSISNRNLALCNSVGVIDSDYRGEITFRFRVLEEGSAAHNKMGRIYQQGDKIGQLLLMETPKVEVVEVKELSVTERGTGGYGSTGDKISTPKKLENVYVK